jgi:hypothetical protein
VSEHIEEVPDGKGGAVLKIWWDSPEENPSYGEKGQAITIRDNDLVVEKLMPMGTEDFDRSAAHIIDRLHQLARAELGPGVIYEIRGKIPNNYGRGRGLAWYTCAWVQKEKDALMGPISYPGELNELGGYMFLGRFCT